MAFSYKITDIKKYFSIVDNKSLLDVSVDFFEDGEVSETRRFSFPMKATKEEIQAELTKVAFALDIDRVTAVASAELEEGESNLKDLKQSLL